MKRFGTDPITVDQINVLLCSLQHRGTDATGIAVSNGDKVEVFKKDEEAWKFTALDTYKAFLQEHLTEETDTVLLHTRAYTVGNPRENKNNHPLTLGKAAIVHNGCISNHTNVFKTLGVERSAETDSDVIRAIVDLHGITPKAIHEMAQLEGSIAAACVHPEYPGRLLLFRSGSPLVIAQVGSTLMWASEKGAIQRASRPWGKWAGFWVQDQRADIRWAATQADSAFLIGPEGLEFHSEFKSCKYYVQPDYSRLRRDYAERQVRIDREAATDAKKTSIVLTTKALDKKGREVTYYLCRNQACVCKMTIPEKLKDRPLESLRCPKCDTWLVEPKTEFAVTVN